MQQDAILEEAILNDIDEADGFVMSLESLVRDSLSDFPDEDASPEAIEAAKIAQSSITKGTYEGHVRYVCLF